MSKTGRSNLERTLGLVRDIIASGDDMRTATAIVVLSENAILLTPAERVDILERTCVYCDRPIVELAWEVLAPMPYAGWALALALRSAKEDVARFLLDKGVDVLQPAPAVGAVRSIRAHEQPLARNDYTRGGSSLLTSAFGRSVTSEAFHPFRGNEQLVGGSFSVVTDISKTCDLLGRLAAEGAFDAVVFDDLARAAVAAASEALDVRGGVDVRAAQSCTTLARRLVALWRSGSGGDQYLPAVLSLFVRPDMHLEVLDFMCSAAPEVAYGCLAQCAWLQDDTALVCRMVRHLSAGTREQNEFLACYLARNGKLDSLREMAGWPGALDERVALKAMTAAAESGHAEVAAWLLRLHPDAGHESGTVAAMERAAAEAAAAPGDVGAEAGGDASQAAARVRELWGGAADASPDDTLAGLDGLLL